MRYWSAFIGMNVVLPRGLCPVLKGPWYFQTKSSGPVVCVVLGTTTDQFCRKARLLCWYATSMLVLQVTVFPHWLAFTPHYRIWSETTLRLLEAFWEHILEIQEWNLIGLANAYLVFFPTPGKEQQAAASPELYRIHPKLSPMQWMTETQTGQAQTISKLLTWSLSTGPLNRMLYVNRC